MQNVISNTKIRWILIYVYIIINIISLAGQLVAPILGCEEVYIYLLSILVCFSFLIILIYCISIYSVFSLNSLFLICLGIFNLGRIFLYILGIYDFRFGSYGPISFQWEDNTSIIVLNYYLVFLTIFSFYNIMCIPKKRFVQCEYSFPGKLDVRKICYFVILINGPILAYFFFIRALQVRNLGYTSIYNGVLEENFGGSGIFVIAQLLFNIAFYMLCCLEDRISYFNRIALMYILVMGIQLIQGSRASFIVSILTVCYIRYRIFNKRIRFRFILIFFLLSVPGIYFIACFRSGNFNDFGIVRSFEYFFGDLSGNLNAPAYYIQHAEELSNNEYPYVLEPIVRIFQVMQNPAIYSGGQSLEMIEIRYNLGHQITYLLSHSYYLSGANVAGNFIAELAEFGYIGVLIGSIVVVKMISFIDEYFDTNIFFRFMSIEWIRSILFMPRGEMFYDTYNLFKYGIIFSLIYGISNMLFLKKRIR